MRQLRGGCSRGHLLLVSAGQVGTCHSPHTAPACFQELQQSRQKASRLAAKATPSWAGLATHPGPSPTSAPLPEARAVPCLKEPRGSWRIGSPCLGVGGPGLPFHHYFWATSLYSDHSLFIVQ